MRADVKFDGKTSIKYNDSVWTDEIHFEMDGRDLLLTFYTNGKRLYIRRNKDNTATFVINFAEEFQPLRCRNFMKKKVKDIITKIGINFGPHLKEGMLEIKKHIKENGYKI